jgi:hypothetical protein
MKTIKETVYYHLSSGGSLQELASSYKKEDEKREVNVTGNTLKASFASTEEHFNVCYEKVNSVDSTKAPDLIDCEFPYAKTAIVCKLKGDHEGFRAAVWRAIKPYGVK